VSDNGTNNYHSFLGYDAVWMVYKYKVLEVIAAVVFTIVVKGRTLINLKMVKCGLHGLT